MATNQPLWRRHLGNRSGGETAADADMARTSRRRRHLLSTFTHISEGFAAAHPETIPGAPQHGRRGRRHSSNLDPPPPPPSPHTPPPPPGIS